LANGFSSFVKSGELEIDIYTVRVKLAFLIPEILPIRGKRARVYYHGIPQFCILCYTPGHLKSDCPNDPVSWTDYIESLKDTGIPLRLFEQLDNSYSTPNNSNNPASSTPRRADSVSRADIVSLIREAFEAAPPNPNLSQSVNQSGAAASDNNSGLSGPPRPPINPTPVLRPRVRPPIAQNLEIDPTVRGRGRG
jgi:hypothetical protein